MRKASPAVLPVSNPACLNIAMPNDTNSVPIRIANMSSMRVWTGGGLVVVLTDEASPARASRQDLTFFPSPAQDRRRADLLDLLRHDIALGADHLAADAFLHHLLDAGGDP